MFKMKKVLFFFHKNKNGNRNMNLYKGAIWPHRYNDSSKGGLLQESNEKLKLFIQSRRIHNFI